MRIHLTINAKNITIPFDHQHLLAGTINKWLHMPGEHGEISLYSFSRLKGGMKTENGLHFNAFASMFFSAHSPVLIRHMIDGIMKDTSMFKGLNVKEVTIQPDPDMSHVNILKVASPVLLKKREADGNIKHVLYSDPESADLLKSSLETKMKIAGLTDETLGIHFDTLYIKAEPKLITYKGIKNKASLCPIIISGKPETISFARNVGLGNSTGIGFGSIE